MFAVAVKISKLTFVLVQPNCEGNVRGIFTQFSCTDAADAACLCASQNFFSGIRDCSAQACSAKADDIKKYLDGSFCQGK